MTLSARNLSYMVQRLEHEQEYVVMSTEPGTRGGGPSAEDSLRDAEFRLREKELRLKEKELDAKITEIGENTRRNVWLASPLLVAAGSTIFGLLGTGVGAALQGFSNTALERQKFESGLIQKALETPDKNEAATNLVFLVSVGLISQFDTQKIAMMARDPQKLPTVNQHAPLDVSAGPNTPKLEGPIHARDVGRAVDGASG